MAQAATMGPPLSPRETRRSGRRSAPSASASTSKSPDSPPPESAPRTKDSSNRSAPPNNNPNPRTKRPKQEDIDDPIPNKNAHSNGNASNHANSNGRSKRKGKEKEKPPSMDHLVEPVPSKHSSASAGTAEPQDDDVEEQGITRCICGMNGPSPAPSPSLASSSSILSPEDDAEGGEFMVQCETCNVWQHGLCMGFESEAQLAAAADYYCEQCKPERHQDLLKRLAKKARESSTHSRNTTSRLSRSHSPTHLLKPPKRRNTMNSRDAAFDESLKELIEATAAEAAAATDPPKPTVNGCISGQSEVPDEDSNGRKKRKRGEDDALPKKRTRSASSASDGLDAVASVVPEELPPPTKRSAGGKSGNSRNRRGGPRKAVPTHHDAVVSVEGDEGTGPSKRSTQTTRGKAGPTPKRPPPSSHAPGSVTQDSASKRNHSGTGAVAGNFAENSRAYRNSHAYAISQQPLFTSWNLPDYLAHLEHMLPTDIPRPLEVRSLAVGPGGRESLGQDDGKGGQASKTNKRSPLSLSGVKMNELDRTTESPSPGLSSYVDEDHGGDYSTRMEELFAGDEEKHGRESGDENDEFVYDGVDAERMTPRMCSEEEEVERSLLKEDPSGKFSDADTGEPSEHAQIILDSASRPQSPLTQPAMTTPSPEHLLTPLHSPGDLPQPYLLPSVSRLRSFASSSPRNEVNHNLPADISAAIGFASPPSRVSDISRSSTPGAGAAAWGSYLKVEREVFRWTVLQNVGNQLCRKRPSKSAIVLGASNLGSPTVLAANGLICIGTDVGRIFVFDFKQTLLCICGNDASVSTVGSTSTVALSHDHTYLASGHISGHIQIFDLKNPQVPARIVTPPSAQAVMSGRQEGHLAGSRIVSVSFVAGRHTAIISADEHGLAFYHSLGKVLFVEASDTIRILGNYPQEPGHEDTTSISVLTRSFRRRKPRNTLLAMATLPLGTVAHPTDTYQIVALLTINKLVMVGLKPSPKTWLKRARVDDAEVASSGRRRGTLVWFPSTNTPQGSKDVGNDKTHPMLAYSWGRTIHLLRVSETMIKQSVLNPRTGKTREIDMGTLVFEDAGSWTVDDAVLALQWLNANQLLAFTAATLSVYDVRTSKLIEHVPFNASALVSPSLGSTTDGSMPYPESLNDVAHSIRAYKGKIFLLCREELQVGTMLTWADKILSLVEHGDFLNAIELTRSYYTGEAPGNRNGLPDAASRAENRMTDSTHSSPDGRGVDRTSLFEGLVTSCARSCMTLDNYDFLFEDLFQYFEDAGITRIYLEQLETFVLAGTIDFVPPRITQRLVALHDDSGQPALAERVIWHIDPSCLDINQVIRLCQTHQLWDALIYVYTRALQDYVSPIVELISLIRQHHSLPGGPSVPNGAGVQRTASSLLHAYKIFPYLINVLSGQTYPSGEPLPPDEAERAKYDVYNFIFNGTSAVWPSKGGHLVLTGNGAEPTYPYARLLLRFDAELLLHSLDIVFEDSFLTDSPGINRLSIVKILLDIASCQDLPLSVTIFINIFIARNIPKYPQYIHVEDIDPRVLYDLLVSLATSLDPETREDRQLAAEYLLSAYTPHDSSEIEKIFENAGFYRILQNRRRHERQWTQLFSSYLLDPSLRSASLLPYVEEVLDLSRSENHSVLPEDIQSALSESLRSPPYTRPAIDCYSS
ncbi:Golgi CORVET complex core vacuolar protein 8-domain-containing protein [Lanmaoa asiatica]|nr:Golgi CORVET complex core vacuolar protein 8-domain-containing protein [Lanmaoa asiatica]